MNEIIKEFKNDQFGTIRVTKDNNGEPWFVAKDVCDALDISNSRDALSRLDEDEKGVGLIDTLGGSQEMSIISESGLYSLSLGSRKPQAKPFKRWITHEVIPIIRKTGGYVGNDNLFIETYLPFADDNTKLLFRNTLETIRKQNELLEEQKPMVEFANTVTKSCDNILMRDMAKLLCDQKINIGEKRLYKLLRTNSVLMDNNIPYQSYIDRGYFYIKENTFNTPYGQKLNKTTLVTPKGQIWIVGKAKEWLGMTDE